MVARTTGGGRRYIIKHTLPDVKEGEHKEIVD